MKKIIKEIAALFMMLMIGLFAWGSMIVMIVIIAASIWSYRNDYAFTIGRHVETGFYYQPKMDDWTKKSKEFK